MILRYKKDDVRQDGEEVEICEPRSNPTMEWGVCAWSCHGALCMGMCGDAPIRESYWIVVELKI